MLKLFKAKKSTEQIIVEIHSEFDSASERLLQEAKDIVVKDNGKSERLGRLGFSSSQPVKEAEETREAQRRSQLLAESVSYYSQRYPFNKFITKEAVEKICNKYGLVFADAQYYKGDVPEKNLIEMEKFVLRNEDKVQDFFGDLSFAMRRLTFGFDRSTGFITSSEQMNEPFYPPFLSEEDRLSKPSFKICAPEKDFDTSRLSKKGHKLELNIPDPIVLQPVNGGYLIVTKWGLEASDDLVKNEKTN